MKLDTVARLVVAAAISGAVFADDRPERGVARISLMNGDVSVRRGDSGDVTAAAVNAPLVVGDHIFTGANARTEIQFDYANMLRVASNAEVRLTELEYDRTIIQLARGLVTFRVLRDSNADVEISTPSIAIRPAKRGAYRIQVREDGTTEVAVRSGEVEIFTTRGSERLKAGHTLVARGSTADAEFQNVRDLPDDDWDRWNERRDRDLDRSRSYSYVSRDVYGAEDLDPYGRWVYDSPYGYVWAPTVSAGWAPYRYGRWGWLDWYGWSWTSYDPWGWAPYHYGRWYWQSRIGWCWWPGGIHSRHYWSPALVGFFGWGGGGFGIGLGGGFGRIGWCPLAPYEVYRPWYGRGYYGGYRNSTVINNVNVVHNTNISNVYRNARVNNGVTAVDGVDFQRGHVGNVRTVSASDLGRASHVQGQLPVTPTRESLRWSDREAPLRAQASSNERFFGHRQPTQVDRVSFDEQRRGMDQVARRTFGDEATRTAGRSEPGVRSADAPARGGEPARSAEGDRGGWRRAGEGIRSADAPPRGGEPVRSTEGDRGGWRRFGEPSSRSASPGQSGPSARTGDDSGLIRRGGDSPRTAEQRDSGDRGGWRRFGEPGQRSEAGQRSEGGQRPEAGQRSEGGQRPQADAPRRESSPDNGWRRLGDSPRTMERRGADIPSRSESPRFERRDGDTPRMQSPRFERQSEPVRINPPIVRERSSRNDDGGAGRSGPSPRFQNSPRFESGPRFENSPRGGGSAPRMESAPRFEGGRGPSGGGGRSGGFEGGHGGGGGGGGGGRVEGGRGGGGHRR